MVRSGVVELEVVGVDGGVHVVVVELVVVELGVETVDDMVVVDKVVG